MNSALKELIASAMKEEPTFIVDKNAGDIYEFLSCCTEVQVTKQDNHRWWDEYENVIEILNDVFIAYSTAKTTGDRTPSEVGYEQPSIDSIKRVYPEKITTTIYK